MRKELDDLLCAVAPNLYAQRNGNTRETCMCWGFPGDGWFSLLLEASEALEKLDCGVVATQVKEKYGTLRFYVNGVNDEVDAIISRAKVRSTRECEDCGAEAKLVGTAWFSTICDHCAVTDK